MRISCGVDEHFLVGSVSAQQRQQHGHTDDDGASAGAGTPRRNAVLLIWCATQQVAASERHRRDWRYGGRAADDVIDHV